MRDVRPGPGSRPARWAEVAAAVPRGPAAWRRPASGEAWSATPCAPRAPSGGAGRTRCGSAGRTRTTEAWPSPSGYLPPAIEGTVTWPPKPERGAAAGGSRRGRPPPALAPGPAFFPAIFPRPCAQQTVDRLAAAHANTFRAAGNSIASAPFPQEAPGAPAAIHGRMAKTRAESQRPWASGSRHHQRTRLRHSSGGQATRSGNDISLIYKLPRRSPSGMAMPGSVSVVRGGARDLAEP